MGAVGVGLWGEMGWGENRAARTLPLPGSALRAGNFINSVWYFLQLPH